MLGLALLGCPKPGSTTTRPGAATLEGTVLRTNGEPLAEVYVMIGSDQMREKEAPIDEAGRFVFFNLAPGVYTIAVMVEGSTIGRRVTLGADETAHIEFLFDADPATVNWLETNVSHEPAPAPTPAD